jgi:Spy/CpxP family protein refolding chaperone
MSTRTHSVVVVTALALVMSVGNCAKAQEQKVLRPELEQLSQTVCERLQAVAEKLGLTEEQQTKIRQSTESFAEKYRAARAERQEMLQEELNKIKEILTPEQLEKAKEHLKDRVETVRETAAETGLPDFAVSRATLRERLEAAADEVGLSPEQRTKIREALAPMRAKCQAQRKKCCELAESEYKALEEILTPEQREKARSLIEQRIVQATMAQAVSDRLQAAADRLELTADQRKKIVETCDSFDDKYENLRSQRQQLMQEELKAIGDILTSEQREKVRNFCHDRAVVVEIAVQGPKREEVLKQLRETIAERLEAVADRLALTPEQRAKIRETHGTFADKYRAQRQERKALRQEEMTALGSILTPEQREKTKNFVEDEPESGTEK